MTERIKEIEERLRRLESEMEEYPEDAENILMLQSTFCRDIRYLLSELKKAREEIHDLNAELTM